jgi:glycosyltransferase involved in cell wall biosynthesis
MISDPARLALAIQPPPARLPQRVGFLSTRFHGTDGVSLEAAKWAHILQGFGCECFWFGGLLDTDPAVSLEDPWAYFRHPEIADLHSSLLGLSRRSRATTTQIEQIKRHLKERIYEFIERFRLELLIPQNILAIPMHLPLGLALTEVLAETGLPTIAHHHDFAWERERFTINPFEDYLRAAFPPALPGIEHVVINSMAQKEMARRLGLPSSVIPNVFDFATPPPEIDDYNRDFRAAVGLSPNDIVFLQPTRLVARKGIELAIDLLRQLRDERAVLVLSHPAGDEGNEYETMLRERIHDAGIRALFVADRVGETRGNDAAGRKLYTLNDVYLHADFVTYPSLYEGFGNAFLEAVYFRKPILVNEYTVYARDIAPRGFRTVTMNQMVTRQVVEETKRILSDADLRHDWVEHNARLGLQFFSYGVARRKLLARLASLFGEAG